MGVVNKWIYKYNSELPLEETDNRRNGRTFIMPSQYITDRSLSQTEICVLGGLASLAKPKMESYDAIETDYIDEEYLARILFMDKKKHKDELRDAIDNLASMGIVTIEPDDELDMSIYIINIPEKSSYIKVNKNEFMTLCKQKNTKSKTNMISLYLILNSYMYKKKNDDVSWVTWVSNGTLSGIIGLSERTIQRTLQQLEDINIIARYTVTLSSTHDFRRNHLISCYCNRDRMRRYVEENISKEDKKGKYKDVVG